MSRPRSVALSTIARAIGCSESPSTAAAHRSASSSTIPSARRVATTRCSASVSVPVLSKTTASSLRASSRPLRSRTSRPVRAPKVVEMAITRGMASPSACGHATTRTETTRSTVNAGFAPTAAQTIAVSAPEATATTVSANAARSASACARERDCCACSTRRMIRARDVSPPILVTSIRREPAPLTVPAMTPSPAAFPTGRDSPVIIDSFMALSPLRTTPSTGTLAPGRTSTVSPTRRSVMGTSSARPSTSRSAVLGRSFASSWSAPCAWKIERISIQWPNSMMVMRVASSSHRGILG